MAAQRIYLVRRIQDDKEFLIMANSQAQALRHIAGKDYDIEVASSMQVAQLMTKHVKVEQAVYSSEQSDIFGGEK